MSMFPAYESKMSANDDQVELLFFDTFSHPDNSEVNNCFMTMLKTNLFDDIFSDDV